MTDGRVTKRRLLAILAALLCWLALSAAEGGCQDSGQHPSMPQPAPPPAKAPPAQPEQPQQPDCCAPGDPKPNRTERLVIVRVGGLESQVLPANVTITSIKVYPQNVSDVITDGHTASWTLAYDPSEKGEQRVFVKIKLSKIGSRKGFCGIEAGAGGNDGPRHFKDNQLELNCYLTIRKS